MKDESMPDVDELKEQEKMQGERLVIEEEEVAGASQKLDLNTEFQKLGRQFAETLQSAWDSEERKRVEKEVREGMQSFVSEVDKVIQEVKASETTSKIKDEAEELKTRVESSDITERARYSFAQGLRWLSEGLSELANQFTPPEKPAAAPPTEEPPADKEG